MIRTITRREIIKTLGLGSVVSTIATPSITRAADAVQWRMQHFYGSAADKMHQKYVENIKHATNNTVDISVYRGGQIVPNSQMLSAVSKGLLDMTHGYGGYWAGEIPLGILESGVPGAWRSIEDARYINYHKGGIKLIRKAYAEHNIHYLEMIFGHKYDLLTTKPVSSLEDLKSMKIRASATMAALLDKLNISTVYLPTQELYVALSTGTVDGVIFGNSFDYYRLKLFEVAKYFTNMNILYPGVTENIFVNKDSWDGLTEQQRTNISLATTAFAREFRDWLVFKSRDIVDKQFFNYSNLPKEDTKKMLEAAHTVWNEQAKRSDRCAKYVEILKDVNKKNDVRR